MRKIQQATGILDINMVADKFFSQKQRQKDLHAEICSIQRETEDMQRELKEVKSQRSRIRAYGVDSSEYDQRMREKEEELAAAKQMHRRRHADFIKTQRLLMLVTEG